jgi:hypothetical protein
METVNTFLLWIVCYNRSIWWRTSSLSSPLGQPDLRDDILVLGLASAENGHTDSEQLRTSRADDSVSNDTSGLMRFSDYYYTIPISSLL